MTAPTNTLIATRATPLDGPAKSGARPSTTNPEAAQSPAALLGPAAETDACRSAASSPAPLPPSGAGEHPTAAPEETGLTAVSLFAGVGGFDLAFERSGVDVVAAVEIDDAARGVLADRFPATTLFSDVREVTGDQLRAAGFVPERGILVGGTPCQDLSVAGRRQGLGEGTRSGLFWEFDRLVAELRPAWIVIENVPGLLSAVCPDPDSPEPESVPTLDELTDDELDDFLVNAPSTTGGKARGACEGGCLAAHGGAMGLILGALADRGYGFAYRVLDAQHFGVPQRRRRVFIVGRAGGDVRGPAEVLLEPEGRAGNPPSGIRTESVVAALTRSGVGGGGGPDDNAAQAGHLIAVPVALRGREGGGSAEVGEPGDPAFALRTPGGGGSYSMVAMAFNPKTAGDMRIGYGDKPTALSRTVETAVHLAEGVRRLTPLEYERLQGFPDGHTATSKGKAQADAPRYRQCGNAVAVPVVQWVASRLVAVIASSEAVA